MSTQKWHTPSAMFSRGVAEKDRSWPLSGNDAPLCKGVLVWVGFASCPCYSDVLGQELECRSWGWWRVALKPHWAWRGHSSLKVKATNSMHRRPRLCPENHSGCVQYQLQHAGESFSVLHSKAWLSHILSRKTLKSCGRFPNMAIKIINKESKALVLNNITSSWTFQKYSHLREVFLGDSGCFSLGTLHILAHITFCHGRFPVRDRMLVVPQPASTYQVPEHPLPKLLPPTSPAVTAKNVSGHCQVSPGGQNCSRLRNIEKRNDKTYQIKLSKWAN